MLKNAALSYSTTRALLHTLYSDWVWVQGLGYVGSLGDGVR